MADNQIAKVVAGKTGFVQQVNQFVDAMVTNFLPRTVAGTVTDLAGSLGETTRRWSNVFAKVLTVKGDNSELVISENISERQEIYSDKQIDFNVNGNIIASMGVNKILPKLKTIVSNNAVFSNNEMIKYIAPSNGGETFTRSCTVENGKIYIVSASIGGAIPSIGLSGACDSVTLSEGRSVVFVGTSNGAVTITIKNNGTAANVYVIATEII